MCNVIDQILFFVVLYSALFLEIFHNLRYAVFRWYGYEHMDMILPRFRFMHLDTLILAQLSDHLSDILFDLSVYDLSPVFRRKYDMIVSY